ncbi:MAG: hypothetical protein U9M92_01385 [Patescibacteria group bacterium]|nr:hypothetical protein [Patescibacteria group bacterium]
MATNEVVVAGSTISASQMKDLWRQIGDGSLTNHHIQALLEHRDPFTISMDVASQIGRWRQLFAEVDIQIDVDSVQIPDRRPGFDRLIVVPSGLTLNRLVEILRQKFTVWLWAEDLDSAVVNNDRSNTQAYAIWVRDRIEADEELKNLSAVMLAKQGVRGQTLMERLLHEWVYFSRTRQHLDVKNVTLCSASRDSDGGVPRVYWGTGDRRLQVNWCGAGGRDDDLRPRAVVS